MITTILISFAAFVSTFLGGLFALRFKDKLHLVLGFSAGAVIGVAFFDLIPEAIELAAANGADISSTTSLVALGFIGYLILDRLILTHEHVQEQEEEMQGQPEAVVASRRGKIGAASFAIHSFIDGAAIGLAFQVSAAVGAVVAAAVLVHDFSDGINTVNLILKNKGGRIEAFRWLIVDALAPVLGVVSTFFFTLPEHTLGIVLALFAGFFLYISASDLLPESHHEHPHFLTTAMTVIGAGVLFVAIKIAGV